MIRLITATIAATALSASAAMAQTSYPADNSGYVAEDPGYAIDEGVSGSVYDSPSEATNYQFQPGGASTAPGFSAQSDTEALEWTPNMGAGTSRSSNANSG